MVKNGGFHEGEAITGWCRRCDEKRLFTPLYKGHACIVCGLLLGLKLRESEAISGLDMWRDALGRIHRTIVIGHEEKGRFVIEKQIESVWRP